MRPWRPPGPSQSPRSARSASKRKAKAGAEVGWLFCGFDLSSVAFKMPTWKAAMSGKPTPPYVRLRRMWDDEREMRQSITWFGAIVVSCTFTASHAQNARQADNPLKLRNHFWRLGLQVA